METLSRDWRRHLVYFLGALTVVAIGLASRRYRDSLPGFLAEYSGDALWGLMVFLLISTLAPRSSVFYRALIAAVFSFAIEFSQLYHAPWIDTLRNSTLGGLVLGFDFVWTDLVCYSVGIGIGAIIALLDFNNRSGNGAETKSH